MGPFIRKSQKRSSSRLYFYVIPIPSLSVKIVKNSIVQQGADAAPFALPDLADISQSVSGGINQSSIVQKGADTAPFALPDICQSISDVLNQLSKQGQALSNLTARQYETLKSNKDVQDAVKSSKNWLSEFWERVKYYFQENRGLLPDWAWILIGVIFAIILVIIAIWLCFEAILMLLHCCGCLWCFGFHSIGVAGNSCASCCQSCCYGPYIAAGSLFSLCQSIAMRG